MQPFFYRKKSGCHPIFFVPFPIESFITFPYDYVFAVEFECLIVSILST